jgi:hypothetical protein
LLRIDRCIWMKWITFSVLLNVEYIIVSVAVESFLQHKRFSYRNKTGTSEERNTVAGCDRKVMKFANVELMSSSRMNKTVDSENRLYNTQTLTKYIL